MTFATPSSRHAFLAAQPNSTLRSRLTVTKEDSDPFNPFVLATDPDTPEDEVATFKSPPIKAVNEEQNSMGVTAAFAKPSELHQTGGFAQFNPNQTNHSAAQASKK